MKEVSGGHGEDGPEEVVLFLEEIQGLEEIPVPVTSETIIKRILSLVSRYA